MFRIGRYRITCKVHDENKVITNVGLGDRSRHPVQAIVDRKRSGQDTFYTNEGGNEAEVYARQHPQSHRRFLTTEPDGEIENNLDFLPYC